MSTLGAVREETGVSEHPNIDLYRRAMQAFEEDDLDTVAKLVSSDVLYVVHGHNSLSGEYRGIAGVREVLGRQKDLTGGSARFEPEAVVADDDVVMAFGCFRATRNGRSLETDHAFYFRFVDGKLAEGHDIPVDQELVNEFWS